MNNARRLRLWLGLREYVLPLSAVLVGALAWHTNALAWGIVEFALTIVLGAVIVGPRVATMKRRVRGAGRWALDMSSRRSKT